MLSPARAGLLEHGRSPNERLVNNPVIPLTPFPMQIEFEPNIARRISLIAYSL